MLARKREWQLLLQSDRSISNFQRQKWFKSGTVKNKSTADMRYVFSADELEFYNFIIFSCSRIPAEQPSIMFRLLRNMTKINKETSCGNGC